MRRLRAIPVLCLLIAVIALNCGKDPLQATNMGGSEVVGKLVTASNTPVANAHVIVFEISGDSFDTSVDILKKTSPVDTAVSNDKGTYKFTKLPVGYYRLFASGKFADDSLFASHDTVYNDYVAPPTEKTHIVEVGIDTMRAPGSIKGKVIFEQGYSDAIFCYIPGSSFSSTTDDTGAFLMANVPAGRYSIYYRSLSGIYAVDFDVNIEVKSKEVTILAPKKLLLSTKGGPPAPVRIRTPYDTANGTISLSWNKVNVANLMEYLVFRKDDGQDTFKQIAKVSQPDTSFIDVVYSDARDTSAHVFHYEIFSRNQGGVTGYPSKICSVSVISPASIRTFLTLKVDLDTVAVFDKKFIICDYTNGSALVDSLTWSLEKPDSIVKRTKKGNNSGADSIQISWDEPGLKTIFCSSRDASGMKGIDTISIAVIPDAPKLRYLSPDTTIEFGGMFRCSLDVFHRFGNCTLRVDLNRDTRYEIKREGLTFDSVFSTNTDTLGGKVNIRITDTHKNVLDTFFIVKIGSAPLHDKWIECDSMPTSRKYLSVCVINKTLYAIGGCKQYFNDQYFQGTTSAVEAYDSVWTVKDTMKTARYSFACASYQNSIYVFGGTGKKGFIKSIERYDVTTNKWLSAGNMPVFRASAASCVLNNKLYLFGGLYGEDSVSNNIYSFDFSSNQWSDVIGHMNTPRYDFQAVVSNGKILLIGGYGGAFYKNDFKVLADVEVFNPSSNQCAPHSTLNTPRSCFSAVSLNNSIYIIGGISSITGTLVNDISVFDSSQQLWKIRSQFPAPHAEGRNNCAAGVLGGSIVIVGGGTDLKIGNPGFVDGVVRKYYP